jgi:hypothetical protein
MLGCTDGSSVLDDGILVESVGDSVGASDGTLEESLGAIDSVGTAVINVGTPVVSVGSSVLDGTLVESAGVTVKNSDGESVGESVDKVLGITEGDPVNKLGKAEGEDGRTDGAVLGLTVGVELGRTVGDLVGESVGAGTLH